MRYKHNKELVPYAKALRKAMTPEERRLWYDFLRSYPRLIRASTVFWGRNDRQLHFPRGRRSARLPRQPRWPPFPLPKNSEGLSGEQ